MSMNEPIQNAGFPEQPPKKGMSGTTKLLLGMGLGCGMLILLCCGGFGLMGYFGAKSVSDKPEVVRQVTDRVVKMKIPADFQPMASIDLRFPVVGHIMTFAVWEDHNTGSSLIFAQFGEKFKGQNQQQMKMQLQQSFPQAQQDDQPLQDQKVSTQTIDIRGKPVAFEFTEGKQAGTNKKRVQFIGTFQGDEGTTLVMGSLGASKYPTDDVKAMLKTIQ